MSDLIFDTKRKILAKYPRFASEIAAANVIYDKNLKYHTAATDGKNVYIDPDYFASLSEDDRMFLIAHEVLHIKFMHMYRLKDKNGVERDMDLWNEATDAIINANLERDGFKIKEGYINRPEALGYSAEEFYQILLKEKQRGRKSPQNKSNGENNDQKSTEKAESHEFGDDHSMWEKAFENYEEKKAEKISDETKTDAKPKQEQEENIDIDENAEFTANRQEKIQRFKNKTKAQDKIMKRFASPIDFNNLGTSQEEIDWRRILERNIKKPDVVWSRRRGIKENNYAYRLEETEVDDEAITEVMLDISGSVDINLLRAFLRQLKPLLRESKLKVGCFNTKFWDFVDINSNDEIDNFSISAEAMEWSGGTDLDLPVRSFSKDKDINKIIFTDGFTNSWNMPKSDLRRENVIWLVYGNTSFKPICGKVIYISERQLHSMQEIYNSQNLTHEDASNSEYEK